MNSNQLLVGVLIVLGNTIPALASPGMIRLGYPNCAACHISPQGGGLLTDYGKGIDLAQSIRAREYEPDVTTRRVQQDIRALLGVQYGVTLAPSHTVSTVTDAQIWHRATVRLTSRQRLTSTVSVDGWPDPPDSGSSVARVILSKALWEYRPIEGLELAIGRDALPSGLENVDHQQELRKTLEEGLDAFPTQIKLFWWTQRVQLTPYVFGSSVELREQSAYGAGALAGVVAFRQHAVFGLSARTSRTAIDSLTSTGAYARLGFGKWGILTEHDRLERSSRTSEGPLARGFSGLTQVFFAPREWLVTSLAAEYVPSDASAGYAYRLMPAAQIRVSNKLTIVIRETEHFEEVLQLHSRSFLVQVFLKTTN